MFGRERDGDAPHFRLWPPVAVGAPWLVGIGVERSAGISVDLGPIAVVVGWVLVVLFVAWNGWSLVLFARRRTGLLPGQPRRRCWTRARIACRATRSTWACWRSMSEQR